MPTQPFTPEFGKIYLQQKNRHYIEFTVLDVSFAEKSSRIILSREFPEIKTLEQWLPLKGGILKELHGRRHLLHLPMSLLHLAIFDAMPKELIEELVRLCPTLVSQDDAEYTAGYFSALMGHSSAFDYFWKDEARRATIFRSNRRICSSDLITQHNLLDFFIKMQKTAGYPNVREAKAQAFSQADSTPASPSLN